jgi:hypothetical protein
MKVGLKQGTPQIVLFAPKSMVRAKLAKALFNKNKVHYYDASSNSITSICFLPPSPTSPLLLSNIRQVPSNCTPVVTTEPTTKLLSVKETLKI